MAAFSRMFANPRRGPYDINATTSVGNGDMPPVQNQAKPGFNDPGGLGDQLRTFAGHLMQVGGLERQGSGLLDEVDQRQQMAQVEARRQQELQNDRDTWVMQQQYKAEHPTPANNDTVADYNFWKQTLTPEQFSQWLQNKINPPQYRQGADGQFYRVDTGGAALAQPTQAPPITLDDWKAAGKGGATPAGSRGFR